MELKVTANLSNAIAQVEKLDKSLGDLSKEASIAGVKIDKFPSSLNKVNSSAKGATLVLTDFGRILQDLPFGITGIANNIDPLRGSFERLRNETGSTGSAVKALAGSLIGGGGLGLAISAITSLASFASIGFSAWTRGLGDNKKELSDTAKATKEASDSIKQIIQNLAQEQVQVSILVSQLKEENLTRQQRENAIEKLKQIAPAYFNILNSEKSTITDITNAYNAYTNSILKAIEAKAREKQLMDVVTRRLELQRKGQERMTTSVDENGRLVKSQVAIYDQSAKATSEYQQRQQAAAGAAGLFADEQNELNNLLKTEAQLLKEITPLASKNPVSKLDKERKKDVLTVAEVLKELNTELDLLSQKELQLNTSETENKIKAVEKAIEDLVKRVGLSANAPLVLKLFADIRDLENQLLIADLKIPVKPIIIPEIKFSNKLQGNMMSWIKPELSEAQKALKEYFETTDKLIQDFKLNTIVGIGETFALAITDGSEGIKNGMKAIFGLVGDFLIQLGKAAVAASKIGVAIKAAVSNPAIGFAAGLAAIIAGNVLKNVVPKFATGVSNYGGGIALVGERGPELVNLPKGSDVIPNGKLNGLGAGTQRVEVFGKILGKDIYFSNIRYGETASRNG